MLTHPQIQRYAAESDLRDLMIAEKEVVLTYLLQLLADYELLDKLAFKGGTCLRKMFVGTDCIHGLAFLADMTPDEQALASDRHQRKRALWKKLRNDLPKA